MYGPTLTKQRIAKKIFDNFNGSVNLKDIYIAVNLIVNELGKALIQEKMVSVKNFGTLTKYKKTINASMLYSCESKKWFVPVLGYGIRFHISTAFKTILTNRKEKFKKLLDK